MVDASITMLLRTCLAKTSKEQSGKLYSILNQTPVFISTFRHSPSTIALSSVT